VIGPVCDTEPALDEVERQGIQVQLHAVSQEEHAHLGIVGVLCGEVDGGALFDRVTDEVAPQGEMHLQA
jgi:hypothetical protein